MLDTHGYVDFEYPRHLSDAVHRAIRSWKTFCDLPSEEKCRMSGGDRVRDFGYMRRRDNGPRADDKELFHVSESVLSDLNKKARGLRGGEGLYFIDAVDDLIEKSASLVSEFARRIEEQYGLLGLQKEVLSGKDHWTFRYLRYLPSGEVLANPHADRGGFTLHLYENFSGGEYLDFDGHWREWPIGNGRTIIFPSMALQHRSRGALKALWHRVSSSAQSTRSRYAMVAFIDFEKSKRFDDAKYRIQDFDPGFNYNLSHRELERYFIDRLGSFKTGPE